MGKRFVSVASVAVCALFVLAACGKSADEGPEPTVTRIPNPPNAPVVGASPPAAATAAGDATPAAEPSAGAGFTITALDIFFDPSELTIPADQPVTISLPNDGAGPHDFSIDAFDISVALAPGTSESVEINAPAGTYEYYCNVPGHIEAGMVGTIVVE